MLADSHTHLDDPRFDQDREAVLQRAWDAGVRRILTIGNGSGPGQMGCGIPIAEGYDWVYTSVGVHPHDASKAERQHYDLLRNLTTHPKVLAVGEIGLDYHYDHSARDIQRNVFRRQLEIATELNLPVIVHSRAADDDTEQILSEVTPSAGVLHCFTSGERLAEFALRIGFMISFSGIVTFSKSNALAAIARHIPMGSLLIETDCPYLAPAPHRGKRNEPAFVAGIARFLAETRGIPPEKFAFQTTCNFDSLFALKTS